MLRRIFLTFACAFLVPTALVPMMEVGFGLNLSTDAIASANPDPSRLLSPSGDAATSGDQTIIVYPMNFSSQPATATITCVPGSSIHDGSTITLTNTSNLTFTYEFDRVGGVTPGNIQVLYDAGMSAADVAQALAARMQPKMVNGPWTGPRIAFSISGATLYLTQQSTGLAGNKPITGTAQADGFTFTGFAGGVNDDRVNIQWAFSNIYPGGTVILKATDLKHVLTPFDLGKFEYSLYVPPLSEPQSYANSRGQPNINSHRLYIDQGMTIQGETVHGTKTTIKNGFETFAIGLNSIPWVGGAITIDGIHFQDAGYVSIYAEQSAIPIKITHNTITNHLSDLFAGQDKPGWDSSLSNNWGFPEDGTHITMVKFDENANTYTDVTENYTKEERVAAFLAGAASMLFGSTAVYATDGNGKNVPYHGLWSARAIFFKNFLPAGLLQIPLDITNNHIDQNETLPFPPRERWEGRVPGSEIVHPLWQRHRHASLFTPVWYQVLDIYSLGHTTFDSNISGNTIRNVSGVGIVAQDDTGNLTIGGNTIELGPAASYLTPSALIPPRLGAQAIAAVYNAYNVYQYPPGYPVTYPTVGGVVKIVDNTITNSIYSKDAGGITVVGTNGSFFGSVTVENNDIQLSNGMAGIHLHGTDVPGCSGPIVSNNTVTGSGLSAIFLGRALDETAAGTANITCADNDLQGFEATSADTSNPDLPAAYVYLWDDTYNNTGTKICVPADTTYSEFIRDLGVDNDFKPDCSGIAMIGYLVEKVKSFNLQHSIDNSLEKKLSNALDSLNWSHAERRQDAVNKLNAFIAECLAQREKKLTAAQADDLITDAREIIAVLHERHYGESLGPHHWD